MTTPVDHVAEFGGLRRLFRLPLGQIGELETLCGAGIGAIYLRVLGLQYKASDLRETVRLGLIGGGMVPSEASFLIGAYHDGLPLVTNLQLATDILTVLVSGASQAATDEPSSGEQAGSGDPATSPPSSQPASSQGLVPAT